MFGNFIYSWKKTKKLNKIQRKLYSPNAGTDYRIESIINPELNYERDKLHKEFYQLCYQDNNVREVMDMYGVSFEDFDEIHSTLLHFGLGQWINGHYASLSTLAYAEPLYYYLEAEKRGYHPEKIVVCLIEYWEGKVKVGGLVKLLENSNFEA